MTATGERPETEALREEIHDMEEDHAKRMLLLEEELEDTRARIERAIAVLSEGRTDA